MPLLRQNDHLPLCCGAGHARPLPKLLFRRKSLCLTIPKISIISTVYNTGAVPAPGCGEHSWPRRSPTFELLLVDDGSHDGSAGGLRRAGTGGCPHPVFHQPNGGPAHARNTGLDNARGDYIGFVDSDDLIGTDHVCNALYSAVQVDGVRLAACAGDCIDADGKNRRPHGHDPSGRRARCAGLLLEAFQTGSFYGP